MSVMVKKDLISAEKLYMVVYLWLIFSVMFLFYTKIEPLMVCDPDDWTYISYSRSAWPQWGAYNPSKVFPETLMGILGYFSAFVVFPITGNYQNSFTIVYAVVVCIFIILYIFSFTKYINKMFKLSLYKKIFVTSIFFAMHFLLFKTKTEYNLFMLTASNLNCFINYLVPALFNSAFAMLCISLNLPNHTNKLKISHIGILLLITYLVIYSNMVVNVLFLAPIFVLFLENLYKQFTVVDSKYRQKNKAFIFYIIIFMLELINLYYEMNGGRAQDIEFHFRTQLLETIRDIKWITGEINKSVLFCTFFVIVGAIGLWVKSRKEPQQEDNIFSRNFVGCLACFVLCILYTFCLFTRIGMHKITCCENIFVMFLYYNILFSISLAYICKKIKCITLAIPIITYITFIQILTGQGHIYKGSISYYNYDSQKCYMINECIITQFIEAYKLGMSDINLILPKYGLGDYEFSGARIAKTLYNHRIIGTYMTVTISNDTFLE